MKREETKRTVKEAYGKIALKSRVQEGCGCGTCGTGADEFARSIGYSEEEIKKIPREANLALGCGNPTAIAALKPGETVLDLGSGAGFDCFLAAERVGAKGKAIGVDMTPEMVQKAGENARKSGIRNVEFRLGEIEKLPVPDNSVDVVISNCVINLSAEKEKVFREIYRALKPGGRVAISDIALRKELPLNVRESIEAYIGCVGGAVLIEEYRKLAAASGLKDVKITIKGESSCIKPDTKDPIGSSILKGLGDAGPLADYVTSVYVEGRK